MKSIFTTFAIVALFTSTPVARAADAAAGEKIALGTCQACHGANGIGITDQYPNLAGQKAAYLEAQLKSFRDGDRTNPIMSPMAKPLSDTDIVNVSAYYATRDSR